MWEAIRAQATLADDEIALGSPGKRSPRGSCSSWKPTPQWLRAIMSDNRADRQHGRDQVGRGHRHAHAQHQRGHADQQDGDDQVAGRQLDDDLGEAQADAGQLDGADDDADDAHGGADDQGAAGALGHGAKISFDAHAVVRGEPADAHAGEDGPEAGISGRIADQHHDHDDHQRQRHEPLRS